MNAAQVHAQTAAAQIYHVYVALSLTVTRSYALAAEAAQMKTVKTDHAYAAPTITATGRYAMTAMAAKAAHAQTHVHAVL